MDYTTLSTRALRKLLSDNGGDISAAAYAEIKRRASAEDPRIEQRHDSAMELAVADLERN